MAQISPQTCTLQWFEYVCVEVLPTKPNEATKLLLEFRSSNFAFLARDFLLGTQLPIVKFQAALVLQYACMSRWDTMSPADQHEFRNLIWGLIVPGGAGTGASVGVAALPAYAVNKLTQVFALTWKRSWRSEAVESKQQFLFSLYSILLSATATGGEGGSTNIGAQLAGCFALPAGAAAQAERKLTLSAGLSVFCFVTRLLRVVVEEFNHHGGGGDSTSSLAAHRQAHASFEAGSAAGAGAASVGALLRGLETDAARFTPAAVLCGLDDCFVIGVNTVSATLSHFTGCFVLVGAQLFHANGGAAAFGAAAGASGAALVQQLQQQAPPLTDVLFSDELLSVCANVKEAARLLIECISWDFGGSGSGSGSASREEKRSYHVPAAWREHLLSPALVSGLARAYEGMRLLYLHCGVGLGSGLAVGQAEPSSAARLSALRCAMLELRNLMLVYLSTAPASGCSPAQRAGEGSTLLEQLVVPLFSRLAEPAQFFCSSPAGDAAAAGFGGAALVLTTLLASANASATGNGSGADAATQCVQRPVCQELRREEFEFCSASVSRCLLNYRLAALAQMPVFTQQVLLLLGRNTFLLSEELATMAARRLELQNSSRGRGAGYGRELLAAMLAPALCDAAAADRGQIYDGELLYMPPYVVDSWRGEVLTQLLDLWCAILENPLLLCYAHLLCPDEGRADAVVSVDLKRQLKDMCGVVFRNLFRCILLSSISQSCIGEDEEEEDEDEEEEGILETSLATMIRSICVIGKYQYQSSLVLVLDQLGLGVGAMSNMAAAAAGGVSAASVLLVEVVLGVTLRFAAQLCASALDSGDDAGDSVTGAATLAGQYDALLSAVNSKYSEQPDVSYLILDCFLCECDPANPNRMAGEGLAGLHLRLVDQVMPALLQGQRELLERLIRGRQTGEAGGGGVQFSPLLLQYTFEFLDLYATTFLQNAGPGAGAPHQAVYELHWGDAGIGAVLEALLRCVHTATVAAPGETQCLRAAYEALAAVAKVPRCKEFLLQSPSYSEIAALVLEYKPSVVSKSHLSRLPVETLRLVVHTLASSLLRVGNAQGFTQCCQVVHSVVDFCYTHSCGAAPAPLRPALIRDVQTSTVLALGLVRCRGSGALQRQLHTTLDFATSRLQAVVEAYHAQQHSADDMAMFLCILLAECAEHQLGEMSAPAAASLYCTVYRCFGLLDRRLRSTTLFAAGAAPGQSGAALLASAEAVFEFELFRVLLSLLNVVGSRELSLEDDDAEGGAAPQSPTLTPQALEQTLLCTLFGGLHLAFGRATPALLAHHPHLGERYFSFIQFISNAHEKQFLAYLGVIPAVGAGGIALNGTTLVMPASTNAARPLLHLERVAEQLLWCIGSNSADAVSTKLILNIIGNIATNYWNHLSAMLGKLSRQQGGQSQSLSNGFGEVDQARLQHLVAHNDAVTALLFSILEHLFRLVSLPPTSAAGTSAAGSSAAPTTTTTTSSSGIPVSTTAYPEQLDSYGATLYTLLVYVNTASTLPNYCPQLRSTHSIQSFITAASALLTGYSSATNATAGSASAAGDSELLGHFQTLLTDRRVEYNAVNSRAHRAAFCANLKAYVAKIKPLLLFK